MLEELKKQVCTVNKKLPDYHLVTFTWGNVSAIDRKIGKVIVGTFEKRDFSFSQIPAVVVANHGTFSWGKGPSEAVHNAVVQEEVAKTALYVLLLNSDVAKIQQVLLDKHYLRKHGADAYYGQKSGELDFKETIKKSKTFIDSQFKDIPVF